MAIEFRCIRCGKKLRVKDEDAGNRARCPSCKAVVDIPPKDQPTLPVVMAREKSDVIDYELFGQEAQHVEITLDPGEVVFAKMSHVMYMSSGIAVEDAAAPDGSDSNSGGVLRTISQVGRRARNGPHAHMIAFCNVAEQREIVAFAAESPSRLVPIHMDEYDRQLLCSPTAILCLARGIDMKETSFPELPEPILQLNGDGVAVLCIESPMHHQILTEQQRLDVASARIAVFSNEIQLAKYECSGVEKPIDVTSVLGPGEIWVRGGSLYKQ